MPNATAVSTPAAYRALALANFRYWTTVHHHVRRELRAWERRAAEIPDAPWRALALDKLATEQFNAQVAATLATLAPRRRRATVVRAIVAAEVLYDYLDGASEQTAPDGRHLYDAFATAFDRGRHSAEHYYADLTTDDGGYLQDLARACRDALMKLPAADAIHTAAWTAATRCATAQTLTHRIDLDGVEPLRRWAEDAADRHGLTWWEYAAGGAASILAVHALIAAASTDPTATTDAEAIGQAYLCTCALSTLLDSLVDQQDDQAAGAHSFVAYYQDTAARATGIAAVAARARTAAAALPSAAHHVMTVAGVAGYYLSAVSADTREQQTVAAVTAELQPIVKPILVLFNTWRAHKRLLSRRPASSSS